jgi:HSP20 family protein
MDFHVETSGQEELNIMSLVPWNPFREIENLRKQVNTIFNHLPGYSVIKNTLPKIDVYQTENDVILKTEIPGIPKENFDVSIEEDRIRLRGHTKRSSEIKNQDFYQSERYYGSFARTVHLPAEVVADKAKVEYDAGVQSVTAPKKDPFKSKYRRI